MLVDSTLTQSIAPTGESAAAVEAVGFDDFTFAGPAFPCTELLHEFAVVGEPEAVGRGLSERWGGAACRLTLYATYRADPAIRRSGDPAIWRSGDLAGRSERHPQLKRAAPRGAGFH